MAFEQTGISVSELNQMIAEAIRRDPRTQSVTVRGEISGFKHHIASGHWYFSLKDESASVSCVMFRTNALRVSLRPADGVSVVVTGYVNVYPRTGSCQLYVTSMRNAGAGDLFLRFEALKQRLYAEGLFDPARKKQLPMVPRKVAVVTSESGAAIHDILNVSRMRSPGIPIVLIPVTVQGEGAGAEIAAGIRKANLLPEVDVIIVGRGGGSMEDLWCFNEEAVARAVAESRIPVVSGVGHEIDTTICDYAADVRASTPSNAAEIVFPDRRELAGRIQALRLTLDQAEKGRMRQAEISLAQARERLNRLSPDRRIRDLTARSALLRSRLENGMSARLRTAEGQLRLTQERLLASVARRQDAAIGQVRMLRERLEAISPLAVLTRGYALIYTPEGQMVTGAAEARNHPRLTVRFHDGEVAVRREEQEDEQRS